MVIRESSCADRIPVVRREDAGRGRIAEFTGVLAALVLRVRQDTREFEPRIHQDRLESLASDRTGRPLDHAIGNRSFRHRIATIAGALETLSSV